ncbi:MAG: hypothetical protein MMC33_010191 [Icmadophila ericetorum]|nr:hypothetical protein [Icmadophila ericetorum]
MSKRAPSPTPSSSGAGGSGRGKPEPEKISAVKEMVDALNNTYRDRKGKHLLKERIQAKNTKVKEPDVFEGDRKHLETFILQCRMYFETNPGKFGSDTDKIKYASTFLRKGAQDWFSPHMRSFLDDPEEDQEEVPPKNEKGKEPASEADCPEVPALKITKKNLQRANRQGHDPQDLGKQ